MLELYQLVQLAAVAEHGTLSKAAEQLHLSQPALSRSMQKLEEELKVTLFQRQKNKIELNQTGELAVEYAKKVLSDVNTMTEMLQAYERSQRTISIGSCAPGPLWEITPLLSSRYPEMTISTEIKNPDLLLESLERKNYQLIITDQPVEAPGILCKKFCEEHLMLSLPPAHPLSAYQDVPLKNLAGETMLLMSNIGSWSHLIQTKMSATKFIIQNELSVFDELVKASALPSFTSDLAIKHTGATQNRVTIPILDPEASATFFCSALKDHKNLLSAVLRT